MGSQARGGRGGYSGSNYDMWSYQQAAKTGNLADSPLNKIQHKFWVTKQAVTRKLNKDEDEHIVASDSELDAKLELFRSIQQTSGRLQRLLEIYQVRYRIYQIYIRYIYQIYIRYIRYIR